MVLPQLTLRGDERAHRAHRRGGGGHPHSAAVPLLPAQDLGGLGLHSQLWWGDHSQSGFCDLILYFSDTEQQGLGLPGPVDHGRGQAKEGEKEEKEEEAADGGFWSVVHN